VGRWPRGEDGPTGFCTLPDRHDGLCQYRGATAEETTAKRRIETTNVHAVGSIWYTSWGYDQTNVDYYEVTRETKASVWLRKIGAFVSDGRLYPDPSIVLGEPRMHRKRAPYNCGNGDRFSLAHTSYADKYPYEGGGQYDTHAAGQPGH